MKLTFEIIKARDIQDGDIFYCTPDLEMNEFGADMFITGTDQIFIKDDYYDEDDEGNYAILVNGGWNIWFKPNEKVVRLAHYGDLIRVLEMVKLGNPDMEVGPNDSNTIVENLIEQFPEMEIDLIKELEKYSDKDEDKDSYEDEDPIQEDDDTDLPF